MTRHPEDFCERCKRPNVMWFAPSELWNAVHGEWGILCPVCFVELAKAAGIDAAWKLHPETFPDETSFCPHPGCTRPMWTRDHYHAGETGT